MRKTRPITFAVIFTMVSLVVLLIIAILRYLQRPLLLQRATLIIRGHDWVAPHYFWLPNGSLRVLQSTNNGYNYLIKKYNPGSLIPEFNSKFDRTFAYAMVADSMSCHVQGDPSLDQQLYFADDFMMSPDGKWITFKPYGLVNSNGISKRVTANIISSASFCWYPASEAQSRFAWLPDGQHWIELFATKHQILIYGTRSRSRERLIRISGHMGSEIIGITPEGSVLTSDSLDTLDQPITRMSLFLIPTNQVHPTSVEIKIKLPRPSDIISLALSLDGKRVAWLARYSYEPGVVERRLSWLFPVRNTLFWGLWTSRLDKGESKEIGIVPMTSSHDISMEDVFGGGNLRWLPDGKHLSFIYRDGLYTVPSE